MEQPAKSLYKLKKAKEQRKEEIWLTSKLGQCFSNWNCEEKWLLEQIFAQPNP